MTLQFSVKVYTPLSTASSDVIPNHNSASFAAEGLTFMMLKGRRQESLRFSVEDRIGVTEVTEYKTFGLVLNERPAFCGMKI